MLNLTYKFLLLIMLSALVIASGYADSRYDQNTTDAFKKEIDQVYSQTFGSVNLVKNPISYDDFSSLIKLKLESFIDDIDGTEGTEMIVFYEQQDSAYLTAVAAIDFVYASSMADYSENNVDQIAKDLKIDPEAYKRIKNSYKSYEKNNFLYKTKVVWGLYQELSSQIRSLTGQAVLQAQAMNYNETKLELEGKKAEKQSLQSKLNAITSALLKKTKGKYLANKIAKLDKEIASLEEELNNNKDYKKAKGQYEKTLAGIKENNKSLKKLNALNTYFNVYLSSWSLDRNYLTHDRSIKHALEELEGNTDNFKYGMVAPTEEVTNYVESFLLSISQGSLSLSTTEKTKGKNPANYGYEILNHMNEKLIELLELVQKNLVSIKPTSLTQGE